MRTYLMLQSAQRLYAGPGDLLAVTQGGYRNDIEASFGTHAGGGVIDISIRNPENLDEFLWNQAPAMVAALRQSGFAAWYRPPDAFGSGSPPHIHAVAVGDRELSPTAVEQLTGPHGYFAGMDGLPPPYGPHPDPYGGPVVCDWMREHGYEQD